VGFPLLGIIENANFCHNAVLFQSAAFSENKNIHYPFETGTYHGMRNVKTICYHKKELTDALFCKLLFI